MFYDYLSFDISGGDPEKPILFIAIFKILYMSCLCQVCKTKSEHYILFMSIILTRGHEA